MKELNNNQVETKFKVTMCLLYNKMSGLLLVRNSAKTSVKAKKQKVKEKLISKKMKKMNKKF